MLIDNVHTLSSVLSSVFEYETQVTVEDYSARVLEEGNTTGFDFGQQIKVGTIVNDYDPNGYVCHITAGGDEFIKVVGFNLSTLVRLIEDATGDYDELHFISKR